MKSLREVYILSEAPVDWRRSFSRAADQAQQRGYPLKRAALHVPKGPPKATKATSIRANPAPGDPLKTASSAEAFETDAGTYFVYKGVNGSYYATFVSGDYSRAEDLGSFKSRKEAIDGLLAHHDQTAAGV